MDKKQIGRLVHTHESVKHLTKLTKNFGAQDVESWDLRYVLPNGSREGLVKVYTLDFTKNTLTGTDCSFQKCSVDAVRSHLDSIVSRVNEYKKAVARRAIEEIFGTLEETLVVAKDSKKEHADTIRVSARLIQALKKVLKESDVIL